ncbi:MAG: hypothetical protein LC789_13745 [Actinobacteria bacterium]|nr:hypothetical protein [Actinomycetota bacterium]MCA1720646.1 hypothetical protein [Actinomycetota bacterium]
MKRLVPLVAAVLALAGCSSSGTTATAAPSPSTAPTAAASTAANPLPTCAPAKTAAYTWPKPVPVDLPRLPGATLGETKQTPEGLTIVRFSTATSLRDGILFIVKRLPAAGYVLGRGDAEATEADAPFNKGDLRGVLRGISRDACATEWLLAVTRKSAGGTGNPLLPMRQGASPSPLPFGNG